VTAESPSLRRVRIRRVLPWVLAVAAVSFVAWMMPVRDHCFDPRVPRSTHIAVSRSDDGACVLHIPSGDVPYAADECAQLKCEPGVVSTLGHARLTVLVGLFGLYLVGILAWAARWRALLAFAGIDLPLSKVCRISVEAQAGGILLPGGIGGDALRIASVLARPTRSGEMRAPASIVVASVLLDRGVGLALIAGVAALLGVVSGGVQGGPLLAALAVVPALVVLGLGSLRLASPGIIERLSRGKVGRALGPVLGYVRDPRAPRAIAMAALFSLGVAAVQFAVIRGLVFALGITPAHEQWVYVGAAMAFIVTAIPALHGGWGTADATYVYFFGLGGMAPGVALAVCLLFRLFWYALGIIGALLQVAGRGRENPEVVVAAGDSHQ
jgi:uncharacterized membrane protein YbhN (UPF0104 family)